MSMKIPFLLLIFFLFAFFPSFFASKSPNAETEIINLTMKQSAQGIPDPKLGVDGQEQPTDGNGGVEPIRLVNLPFKGREKVIGGVQRDKLLERLGRLEPLSKTAASGSATPLLRARQLRIPLAEDGVPNSLPSAGLNRILSASSNNRLSPSTNSFGFGANSPLSLTQLAAILRQSRNPTGNDQQNPSNLAAIQAIQREQQRFLQQQQQLALQIAIQQRAQRLQQQQFQQQLLASQKGNEGRTIDLPSNNNIFPGHFGRNSLPNVQIQRPSNNLNGIGSSAGNTNALNGLGQSSLISTRLASDDQDIASLLQSIRSSSSNSPASLLNGQTNPLEASNIISPSNVQPNSFKIVADKQQQKALQQILEQEQRILDLLNNKRDLQNVQEQQQRILALLNQQHGQQGELAKTLVVSTPTTGGLLNGGISGAGANIPIGQQPNLLARILNVGQPTAATAFLPASASADIQQQPIFISSSHQAQQLGNNLDLSQLFQQQIVPSTTNGRQQSSQLLQILQGGQQPIIFGGNIPFQSPSLGQDKSNGGIISSPFTQPNPANLLLENDGQFPTSSLALNDANSNPNSDASGLLFFQRGQPKTGIQPENDGQKGEENEKEGEEENNEQKEENSEEEEKETN